MCAKFLSLTSKRIAQECLAPHTARRLTTPKHTPIAQVKVELPLSADDLGDSATVPLGATDPTEVSLGGANPGVAAGEDSGVLGARAERGGLAGDSAGGEAAGDLNGGEAAGDLCGGVAGDVGGRVAGDVLGGVAGTAGGGDEVAARVSTSSFIPAVQCPGVEQMKYLLPGDVRETVVDPPVLVLIGLVAWQESYSALLTSVTSWLGAY